MDCEILSTAISCHLANALYSRTIANCMRGLRMNINDVEITVMLTTVSNIAYESLGVYERLVAQILWVAIASG